MAWWILSSTLCLFWLAALIRNSRNSKRIPLLSRLPLPADASALPKLSVVVPARNEEKAIRKCLESLLAQDYPNLEIIAVDDRSEDSTGRIMDDVAAISDSRLQALHLTECPDG